MYVHVYMVYTWASKGFSHYDFGPAYVQGPRISVMSESEKKNAKLSKKADIPKGSKYH